MKWFLLTVIVAAIAAGYLYRAPDLRRDWFAGTPLAPPPVTVVYKWRDDAGRWQITDTPPSAGTAYERLEYHREVNVMPLAPRPDRTTD